MSFDESRKCKEIWNCTSCLKTCSSFTKWSDHIRELHMNNLECVKCSVKFTLSTDVVRHFWTHHLETVCICEKCDEMFDCKRRFIAHTCVKSPADCDGWGFDENGRIYLPYHYNARGYFISKLT